MVTGGATDIDGRAGRLGTRSAKSAPTPTRGARVRSLEDLDRLPDRRSTRADAGALTFELAHELVWIGLLLNHRFASPGHKAEIDAERERRSIGIIAGHPGASGYIGHPGADSEDASYPPE